MKREKPTPVRQANDKPKDLGPARGPGDTKPFVPGEKDYDPKPASPKKPKL